jgi:hypothetical protein
MPQKKNPAALARRGAFFSVFDRYLPAAAATATTTATARTAATTAAAALAFLRFVDAKRSTSHILTVQGLNRTLCISTRHFNEPKAARTASFAIVDQRNRLHCAVLLEQLANLSFVCGERQVTYIDLRHNNTVSL